MNKYESFNFILILDVLFIISIEGDSNNQVIFSVQLLIDIFILKTSINI